MLKKNMILDVDGTLWDTTSVVADSWMDALKSLNITTISITSKLLMEVFGRPMNQIGDIVFASLPPAERPMIMDACCQREHDFLLESEEPMLYPQVLETIRTLSETANLFVVSNCQSGYIELFIGKFKLQGYITDTECYGDTLKSKGENIQLLMERNHITDAYYVGDTQGDCDASKYADIPFIFASYGFGKVNEYFKKITCFQELLHITEEETL